MQSAVVHPAAAPSSGAELARHHHTLRIEIGELRGMIDSCPVPQRSARYHQVIAVLVSRLGERLRLHIASEEDVTDWSGLLVAAPGVSTDVARLRRAHVELLADAQRLADLLRAPAAPPDGIAQVLHWLEALASHEAEETAVLAHTAGAAA